MIAQIRERHRRAIQLRLEGKYEESRLVFQQLVNELRTWPHLQGMLGRVYRDMGMLFIDKGQYSLAEKHMRWSLQLLDGVVQSESLGDSALIPDAEYANSLGFMARALAMQGSTERALELFETTDTVLMRYSPQYDGARVNNAIWWLRWLNAAKRRQLIPEYIDLARHTPGVKKTRVIELMVLGLFGRRVYDMLKRIVR